MISADVRLALIKAASLADGGPVAVDTEAATIRVSADVLAQVRMGIAPPWQRRARSPMPMLKT